MSNACGGQRSSGHLAVLVWSTTQVGGAMILRTSCEVNRNGWGACERALKLHLSRKGLSGKAKAKTGIGKSDLPGLQGGPRKRDFVLGQSARASALSRPPGDFDRRGLISTVMMDNRDSWPLSGKRQFDSGCWRPSQTAGYRGSMTCTLTP